MSKKYILFLITTLFLIQPSINLNAALRTKVRICAVKGSVQTSSETGDGLTCPLKRTMNQTECRVVNEATFVETGDDGWATIEYQDGRKVKILPNTKVLLSRNTIYVESGSSWFKVEKNSNGEFVVKTPTAITGIRGTEFIVNVEKDGSTNIQLIEGSIEVSDARKKSKLMLAAGMEVNIPKGSTTLNTDLLKINENNKWWTDWPTLIPIADMPGYIGGGTNSSNDGNTLFPVADNHVYAYSYSNWNNANWGKYEQLGAGWNPIGGEKRAYLKFDLSGFDLNSFDKASLRLFYNHTGGGNRAELGVYAVEGPWTEGRGTYKPASAALPGELTWNNQPKIAQYPTVYFNPGQETQKWIEVDVTTLVKAWLNGFPNHGMLIKAGENYVNGSESMYGFYSREAKDEGKKPHLVLNGSNVINKPQDKPNTQVDNTQKNSRPWVIGTTSKIHYGTGSAWVEQPGGGRGKDIAIDKQNRPWVIGTDNGIYYHDGSKWVAYPGGGKGIAIAIASDGTPWIIGTNNRVYYGTGSGWAEQAGGGIGKDIAIDKQGRPWVIGTNNGVFYYEGRWIEYRGGGRGSKLAVSPDGVPWVIGNDKDIFYHDGSKWVRQPGGKVIAKDIAIDDKKHPWILDAENKIYYHNGNNWIEYPGGGRGFALAISADKNLKVPSTNNFKTGTNNLLRNGNFENPEIGWFKSFTAGQDIDGWKVIKAPVDLTGTYFKSAEGKQSIDLHGSPGFGGIEQTFITQHNKKYQVVFDFAGNPAGGPTIKEMKVSAAGQSKIFKFDGTGKTTTNMGWTTQTWSFTANSNYTTLTFETLSKTGIGNYGPAIDNVRVHQSDGKINTSKVNSNNNISDKWLIDQHNGYNGTLILQQTQAGKFTGTATWDRYESGTIVGQLSGNTIEFTISYPGGVKGFYKGTMTQNGTLIVDGTVRANNGATSTWSGSKE